MQTVIFHVDVNSAFLSWSAVKRLQEEPGSVDLRDIPSAVGGDVETRHGVITAKSIPAKKYHVKTGEPVVKALEKCPNLVLVPSDFQAYRAFSRELMEILRTYANAAEQVSIDEAYLDITQAQNPVHLYSPRDGFRMAQALTQHIPGDMESPCKSEAAYFPEKAENSDKNDTGRNSGSVKNFMPARPSCAASARFQVLPPESALPYPYNIANRLREDVYQKLGFTVNVGISGNRLLAKMASDFVKPGRIHTLWPEEIPAKMWPLPIGELHGCGRKSAARLHDFGILSIGDAAHADLSLLQSILGEKGGLYIYQAANGISSTAVSEIRDDAKSYSNETTVPNDIFYENYDTDAIPVIHQLSESVATRLQRDGVYAGTIEFSVKTDDFRRHSRQVKLSSSTNDVVTIEGAAQRLARELLLGSENQTGAPLFAGNALPLSSEAGLFARGKKVRLIGVGASSLDHGEYRQLDLFGYMQAQEEEQAKEREEAQLRIRRQKEEAQQKAEKEEEARQKVRKEKEKAQQKAKEKEEEARWKAEEKEREAAEKEALQKKKAARQQRLDQMVAAVQKKYGEQALKKGS